MLAQAGALLAQQQRAASPLGRRHPHSFSVHASDMAVAPGGNDASLGSPQDTMLAHIQKMLETQEKNITEKTETLIREQSNQVLELRTEVTASMNYLESKLDTAKKDTDERISKLEQIMTGHGIPVDAENTHIKEANAKVAAIEADVKKLQAMQSATPSTASSFGGSARAFSDSNGAKARRVDGPKNDSVNKNRKWIGTFPRILFARERRLHYTNTVLPLLPADLAQEITPNFPRTAKTYSLEFSTELAAKRFQDLVAVSPDSMNWTDPRNQSIHQIKSRGDMPLDVRVRQRACSHIYARLRDMLTAAGHDLSSTRLGVNGYQGMINLYGDADNGEIWEMVYIKGNEVAGWSFEPNLVNCRIWKLNDEAVIDAIAKASTSANDPEFL